MDSSFLCLNGDIVVTPSYLQGILDLYKKKKGSIMSLASVEDPSRFGVVTLKDEKVVGIEEKPKVPKSNLINAGIYLFTPEIFTSIERTEKSARGEYEITDSLKIMMNESDVFGYTLKEPWIEIGLPWDLLRANATLMKNIEEKIEGEVGKYVDIKGPVQIGAGSTVKNGSNIQGPVIIGGNSSIGPNCFIRPTTEIGSECKVGNAVEVKNSIIMDGSNVPHNNYVGDSIIGQRCNLGAGTKVANVRLDSKNISVVLRGKPHRTQLRKLGVIMGDDVKTGINSSIDPGTIMGEGSYLGPNALASGSIAPRSRIH
jgi:bifunctional UDP-N-acetylglucosamine pyrophosphorylase/glucosamine-1-phosphate N-acetyltransferase